MQNEEFLWAGIPFMSGISGQQAAPCGAISAAAVALGLRQRCPIQDKPAAKRGRELARRASSQLLADFTAQFGEITCRGLLGLDFSKPGEYQRFRDAGIWKDKCERYLQFIIAKLYEYEERPPGGANARV